MANKQSPTKFNVIPVPSKDLKKNQPILSKSILSKSKLQKQLLNMFQNTPTHEIFTCDDFSLEVWVEPYNYQNSSKVDICLLLKRSNRTITSKNIQASISNAKDILLNDLLLNAISE